MKNDKQDLSKQEEIVIYSTKSKYMKIKKGTKIRKPLPALNATPRNNPGIHANSVSISLQNIHSLLFNFF